MANRTISKIVAPVLLAAFVFLTSCTTGDHGGHPAPTANPKQEMKHQTGGS
jgi:hypothetical protein